MRLQIKLNFFVLFHNLISMSPMSIVCLSQRLEMAPYMSQQRETRRNMTIPSLMMRLMAAPGGKLSSTIVKLTWSNLMAAWPDQAGSRLHSNWLLSYYLPASPAQPDRGPVDNEECSAKKWPQLWPMTTNIPHQGGATGRQALTWVASSLHQTFPNNKWHSESSLRRG